MKIKVIVIRNVSPIYSHNTFIIKFDIFSIRIKKY